MKSAADRSQPTRRVSGLSTRGAMGIVLLTCWLASLACSTQFAMPAALTATAAIPTLASTLDPVLVTQPTSLPTATPVKRSSDATLPPPRSITPAATPGMIGGGGEYASVPVETTVSPTATSEPTPTTPAGTPAPPILYYTQAGDTLAALALRFNVQPSEIKSREPIPGEGLFNPGVLLLIPPRLGEVSAATPLLPDSEMVYSPSAIDFDIQEFVKGADGYLSNSYKEWRSDGWYDGVGIIHRVAIENSANPRLLLAILEQQSHWVYGQPRNLAETDYPIGWLRVENDKKGLYYQLSWAVGELNKGYYGWRNGSVTTLTFPDGKTMRLDPTLNAGSVGLMYLFSRLYNQAEWAGILYSPDGFATSYEKMFGSPWMRAQTVEPLFPATLTQPTLELPFLPGHTWAFTGGPHAAWGSASSSAPAALDFAPSATEHGCAQSDDWVVASASGLVVRSANGLVMLDLDGDGYEQTGWDILYLHLATQDRVPVNTWVNLNDHLGHPSCEGGMATGTHTHMARKYNGEWILADGFLPFTLSGWRAHNDPRAYQGTLTKGDQVVYASQVGSYESRITRPKVNP